MKKFFTNPEIEVTIFETDSILTASTLFDLFDKQEAKSISIDDKAVDASDWGSLFS